MKATILMPGLLFCVAVVLFAASCEKSPEVPSILDDPGSVHSITLETYDLERESKSSVVIDDPARIKDLLSVAAFKQKPPCACAHLETLTFRGTHGEATASICDHCFDFYEGGSCTNYEMTEQFRSKCRRLMADAKSAMSR